MTGAPMSPGSPLLLFFDTMELRWKTAMDGKVYVAHFMETDQPPPPSPRETSFLFATLVGFGDEPNMCSCSMKD